ncbi:MULTISPECIES: M20 family peptidase [unclassified Caulobacter]|uniref:M20 family peptidase n=1 Tax=unclassified Caulobacter TaxID=2648921 RepID=UPI000D3D36B9|nr:MULTISPECIES: M20 family peptidase [unclassified Caulobacter]PTS89486.1 peptidase M20 [Caulobacter sp. HMWF009]PTT06028.1 peptidase M20 [Caulobacter sp. HMWF025]
MGFLGKAALAGGGLLVAVGAVVAVRTATFKAPAVVDPASVTLASARPVDVNKATANLAQAVRFQTVSHQDRADDQPAEWDRLHAWLQVTYPAAHAAMTREVIAGHTLVYTWTGSRPDLAPVVLMAHQDVVPVTPGSEAAWTHPPFDGVVADGAVWGRGSIDDKGSLVTLFEALESVAASGFKPVRTVIIVSGHDEEVRGVGARAAADLLKARGIKAQFVLDEGMVVVEDHPVTGKPTAIIGTAEKGYATLKVVAPAVGGHSSAPPPQTGVATLSRAVLAIADKPFPMKFSGPGADMLKALAPHASPIVKMAAANTWLFSPLLVKVTAKTPAGAAMLHTTIAPTMLKGSPKENVLPQDATAWINYRIAPGDSSAKVMAQAKAAVGDLPVELSWTKIPDEPSRVSSTESDAWKTLAGLAAAESQAPVVPGLVTAGTDSRYLAPVATDVYRFQPLRLSVNDTKIIHGTDEHITVANVERMVRFYQRLIETAAAK